MVKSIQVLDAIVKRVIPNATRLYFQGLEVGRGVTGTGTLLQDQTGGVLLPLSPVSSPVLGGTAVCAQLECCEGTTGYPTQSLTEAWCVAGLAPWVQSGSGGAEGDEGEEQEMDEDGFLVDSGKAAAAAAAAAPDPSTSPVLYALKGLQVRAVLADGLSHLLHSWVHHTATLWAGTSSPSVTVITDCLALCPPYLWQVT
jgi:hypothetical protein